MKTNTILWLATAALLIASIIDIVDGYIPKMISSISITIALVAFALGQGKGNKKLYNWVAYVFISLALLGFVYRLLKFYNVW
jgi:hypothetical protein